MTDTTTSINAINECLRHLVWLKSDMAAVKKSMEKAPLADIPLFGNIPKPVYEKTSFEFNDTAKAKDRTDKPFTFSPQPSVPVTPPKQDYFVNPDSLKRRVDILSTPQFIEVIRYVTKFENPSQVLSLLWLIADGPNIKEDLDMVKDYLIVLDLQSKLKVE